MPAKNKKPKLTHNDLEKMFDLMSHSMISFDCGQLCKETCSCIPACCDNNTLFPLLFKEEYVWLTEHKGADWKSFKPCRKKYTEFKNLSDHLIFAKCPGIEKCNRDTRALACRFFPFEPYVDRKGKVLGLTFMTDDPEQCPLVTKPVKTFSKKYIRASIKVWQSLVDTFPDEKRLYKSESRKRERHAAKKGTRLRILKP